MQEVLVIAGEKSGEEHFLSFCDDIKSSTKEISFYGVGGDEMKKQGVECLYDLSEFSSMGFSEPIRRLPFYFQAMERILEQVVLRKTKFAILIDFQEFNLKIAEKLTNQSVKVFYYVAPQAWIWRENRCEKLAKYTFRLFTILPFEQEWFEKRGVNNIISCQHPVYKKFKDLKIDLNCLELQRKNNFTFLFLPGSRNSEVAKLLPVFHKCLKKIKNIFSDFKFSIVISDSISLDINQDMLKDFDEIYSNTELDLALREASFCVAASGTVNLECAFYKVPTIVCYETSRINHFIGREVIKYKGMVSLVNVIAGKEIYPELLQDKFNASNLFFHVKRLIGSPELLERIKTELETIKIAFELGDQFPGRKIGELISNDS